MIKCVCDRCAEDLSNQEKIFFIETHLVPGLVRGVDFQICLKCYDKFLKFFKEDINND